MFLYVKTCSMRQYYCNPPRVTSNYICVQRYIWATERRDTSPWSPERPSIARYRFHLQSISVAAFDIWTGYRHRCTRNMHIRDGQCPEDSWTPTWKWRGVTSRTSWPDSRINFRINIPKLNTNSPTTIDEIQNWINSVERCSLVL